VTAVDTATKKSETIEIKDHGKGKLTDEQIEAMILDAEKFAEEDKAIKAKIDAKNQLENYIYQMKNSIEDKDKLAEKVSDEDKNAIKDALTDA
jgi:heat shock protein 5